VTARATLYRLLEAPEKIVAIAVRTADGDIITGDFHMTIRAERDVDIGATDGFVTDTGRFVDREEAYELAQAAKQLNSRGLESPDGQLAHYDVDAFIQPPHKGPKGWKRLGETDLERVVKCAARSPKGIVMTGPFHPSIFDDAWEAGMFGDKNWGPAELEFDSEWEMGFVTSTGRFVNRAKAYELAVAAGQYDPADDHNRSIERRNRLMHYDIPSDDPSYPA
jgi:hypothetical protein